MIFMGIDPGIANVGFGVIDIRKKRDYERVIISGTLITNPRHSTEHRIYSIATRIKYLIGATNPDKIIIEDFIPFRARKNMGLISQAYGAIVYVSMASDAEVVLVRPNIWMRKTLGLTQTAKFSKITIMRRVDRYLNLKTRVEHEAEALGMALYGGGIKI